LLDTTIIKRNKREASKMTRSYRVSRVEHIASVHNTTRAEVVVRRDHHRRAKSEGYIRDLISSNQQCEQAIIKRNGKMKLIQCRDGVRAIIETIVFMNFCNQVSRLLGFFGAVIKGDIRVTQKNIVTMMVKEDASRYSLQDKFGNALKVNKRMKLLKNIPVHFHYQELMKRMKIETYRRNAKIKLLKRFCIMIGVKKLFEKCILLNSLNATAIKHFIRKEAIESAPLCELTKKFTSVLANYYPDLKLSKKLYRKSFEMKISVL
jgi:hypothetical protein